MSHRGTIGRDLTKTAKGIEVAPWLSPLVSRRDGYNVKILDVFDSETLRTKAIQDPNWAGTDLNLLEHVDFVGSATEIADLVPADEHGSFDYVVSSHNFEHLPNPIKFLQGCTKVLKPGGVIAMLVPDRRGCMDYYRPSTTLGEWIEAWQEDRRRPTARQVFNLSGFFASSEIKGKSSGAFGLHADPEDVIVTSDVRAAYAHWAAGRSDDLYEDTHCNIFTPAWLELLLFDLRHLGLIELETDLVGQTRGIEFFVRLRKPDRPYELQTSDVAARRTALMRASLAESAVQAQGRLSLPASRRFARAVRSFGRRLRGVADG